MTSADAAQLFRDALAAAATSSEAFVPTGADPTTYRGTELARLRAAAVTPIAATVHPDASARTFGDFVDRPYVMFIVARAGTAVLLLNPETRLFTLGTDGPDAVIRLTGFASDDPLAEWVS